jgi:hypothetical protein
MEDVHPLRTIAHGSFKGTAAGIPTANRNPLNAPLPYSPTERAGIDGCFVFRENSALPPA